MPTVRFNLLRPLGQLEALRNHRYEYGEIARLSGLSRQTVRNVMKESPKQINIDTLTGLMRFFADEGMPVTIDRFFDVQMEE